MNVDNSSTRRWYQLHASTWFLLALVIIALIAMNLPYEYGDAKSRSMGRVSLTAAWQRTESMLGGWPLRYVEIREPAHAESPERDWSLLALAADLIVGIALMAVVVAAYEQRRRRRTKRWQLTLSDLCFLMFVVCSVFGTWHMMARRYRTQLSAMFQLQIEGGTVATQLFLPKVIIGPRAASPARGHFHAWLIDQLWNHELPTAARLTKVNNRCRPCCSCARS